MFPRSMKCSANSGLPAMPGPHTLRGPAKMRSAVRFSRRATPRVPSYRLRDAFSKLENDKEFLAELRKVGGDDADLLMAKDAEPVLRQVLTVTPGVQEFVKAITKKHLQR